MPVSTRRNKTKTFNDPAPEKTPTEGEITICGTKRFKIRAKRKRATEDDVTQNKKDVENGKLTVEIGKMNVEKGKFNVDIGEMKVDTGKTRLHWMCIKKNIKPMTKLIATQDINVNIEDRHGITPLHQAFSYNNDKAIALLLAAPDINVNLPDKNGITPLHRACYYNNRQAMAQLLAIPGININARDFQGITPIMQSAKYGRIEALKTLLDDPRVDIDARSNNGRRLEEMVVFGMSALGIKSKCLQMIQKGKTARESEEEEKNIYKNCKNYIEKDLEEVRVNVRIKYINKIENINENIAEKEKSLNGKVERIKRRMKELEEWQNLEKKTLDRKFEPKIAKLEERRSELEKQLTQIRQNLHEKLQRKMRDNKQMRNRHQHEKIRLEKKLKTEDKQKEQELARMKDMIDQLTKHLENTEKAFDNGASFNEHETLEAAKDTLECPVCMEMMKPPTQIWMCPSSHVVCEACKHRLINQLCPTCRTLPVTQRAFIVEKIARTLFRK